MKAFIAKRYGKKEKLHRTETPEPVVNEHNVLVEIGIGAFAEYISIHENDLALKPKNLSMVEAASIPLVGLTAWQALVEIANLKQGQKVFIQAGSGGVGTFAIQLAKYIGATMATTTSAENIPLVKRLGADIIIDYKVAGLFP